MSEKTEVRDIEGLSGKPVTEIVAEIAASTPAPAVAEPEAGRTSQEIADAAYEKFNTLLLEDIAKIQEAADARRAQAREDALEPVKPADPVVEATQPTQPKEPKKEVQAPLDELGVPLEMEEASNIKIAQIVWHMALQKGREQEGLKAVADKLGKNAKDVLPLTMGNIALSADMSKTVLETYPDLTGLVWDAARSSPGNSLMEKAGYTKEEIKKIPHDVLDHWAISDVHDMVFQPEGPSLIERLKEHKATIKEALGNDHVQRSMKWAGLIIGCATGGIVAKVGVKGVTFLADKLAQNPKVQELAKTLEDKSIKFVSNTFKIDEAKVRERVEHAKGIAEEVSNSKWATAAKAAALVGLGVAMANLDFVHDAATMVAEQSVNLFHGATELASAGVEYAGSAVEATKDFVVEGTVATKDFVVDSAHTAGSVTADGLRAFANVVDPSVTEQVASGGVLANGDVSTGAVDLTTGATVPDAEAAVPVAAAPAPAAPAVHHVSNTEINNLVHQIYADNKGVIGNNPDLIFEHQKLTIGSTVVDVKPGDSLWKIAEQHLEAGNNLEAGHSVNAAADVKPAVVVPAHPATPAVITPPNVDMLKTEALPNGTPAQVEAYMNLVTQRDKGVDSGMEIS